MDRQREGEEGEMKRNRKTERKGGRGQRHQEQHGDNWIQNVASTQCEPEWCFVIGLLC